MGISKIRCGFVTNSSSSSFILSFKNKREAVKFFEDCDHLSPEAKSVMLYEMEHAKHLSEKKMREYLTSEFADEALFKKMLRTSLFDRSITLDDDDMKEVSKDVEEVMEKQKDNWFNVAIEQGDDDEVGSELEHEILPTLDHVLAYFSHH